MRARLCHSVATWPCGASGNRVNPLRLRQLLGFEVWPLLDCTVVQLYGCTAVARRSSRSRPLASPHTPWPHLPPDLALVRAGPTSSLLKCNPRCNPTM